MLLLIIVVVKADKFQYFGTPSNGMEKQKLKSV